MITQEQLKKLLHYDPDTGVFTWLVSRGKAAIGKVAGHVCLKNGKAYRFIGIDGELHRAHRLAWLYMTGDWPTYDIDHISGDGVDNRWVNFRDVPMLENSKNQRLRVTNTTGVTGVHIDKQTTRYRAEICVNSKGLKLGRFEDFFEAVCARKSAELAYGFHENHGSVRPL